MIPQQAPVQEARQRAAAQALASGRHKIPLACGFCYCGYVYTELDADTILVCTSCGRETRLETAHVIRRQRIKAYLAKGIDVPGLSRRR